MAKKKIKTSYGFMLVDDEQKAPLEKGGVESVIASGRFPCVSSREGPAAFSKKGRRLKETIDKIKQEPVNIARGKRTAAQQERKYGKVFEHNSKMSAAARRRGKLEQTGNGRIELVGQIPREALLEEARSTGEKVSSIVEDPGHLNHIAKKKGFLKT